MKNTGLLNKAAQQALTEALGYDEARAYYLLLNNKGKEFEQEFSYSKRYRLLKRMFETGAVGKIKPEQKEFYNYFLLPPTFLHYQKTNPEIIEHLEQTYLKNFKELFEKEFTQLIIKEEKTILLFLLKYFMKEQANLTTELDLTTLGTERKKVRTTTTKETKIKTGTIDHNITFEFTNITTQISTEYIGHITNKIHK